MITNLPPKSQTLRMLGLFAVGGGVMKVCSFRCLFLFWLDCVRLGVSPRACCSHYGCGNLLLMAAICCMHQGYQEQRLAVHGNQTKE